MAAPRQIAFYGKGGTGKPTRKAEPVTAPIEDRSLGSPSKNEAHFHSRMNVMANMRGGHGFRVPSAASRKAIKHKSKGQPRPKKALILLEGTKNGYWSAASGVMISDSSDHRFDAMPFGGFKYDGMDREGVRFASEDMTQPKVVCINRMKTQSQACSNPSTIQGAKNV